MSEGAKHVLIQGSILGLLALAAVAAILLGAAGGSAILRGAPAGPADRGAAEAALRERGAFAPDGCCRWELAAVSAHGPVPAELGQAGATMLLNQCTGHTWILSRAPHGEFEWVELPRLGRWGFRLDLE